MPLVSEPNSRVTGVKISDRLQWKGTDFRAWAMIETDEVIHSLNRLQLCAYLSWVEQAEFAALRDMLGVADSVASKHLAVLRDAGYVSVTKSRGLGRPRTWVRLTDRGRVAYIRHADALQKIIGTPRHDTPPGNPGEDRSET